MSDESEIIQSVYAVTVEPERYDDLVVTWVEKLSAALFTYQDNPEDADSQALNEHVERATKVISLLAASRADEAPGGQPSGADAYPDAQPVMRIDASGRLLDANASAQRAYGVVSTDRIDKLPFDTQALRTLHALSAKLLRSAAQGRSIASESGTVPLIHAVRTDNDQTVYLSLALDTTTDGALYLTSTDIIWPNRLTTLMQDSFALTTAECEVGRGLVEGLSLNGIAESRHTSINTVRVHARSLFSKTSTSGQREFIRMAIGLAALYPDDESSSVETSEALAASVNLLPEASAWQTHRMSDGRELPYAIIGPSTGRPCLFVHDALFGPAWPRALADLAVEANLQVVFVARQGWLGAPLYPDDANAFEQNARDTRELMAFLGWKNVLLIGRVIGATYGYEIIRADPDRYIGLLGITPALPIGEREDINRMAPHHRLLTVSIGANPALLKFVTRAGSAIYDRFGPKRFLSMVYRSSAEDLALVEQSETLDVMSAGLALGGGGARHPFYHELKQRPSAQWHPGLEMSVPFHVLLGERDPSARPRRAQRMIELGVPLRLTRLPGCGELFIYSHAESIVRHIRAVFEEFDQKTRPAASL